MKKWLMFTAILMLSVSCTEEKKMCTDKPKSEWKEQKAFQQELKDQGYKINEFKVTDGNCYEIYGWNKAGEKVEIYFNPVDGSIVKEEKH